MNAAISSETTIRFPFGKNWRNFTAELGYQQIEVATTCLYENLGNLQNKSFLDIGSGSGIHSLAAVRLGADKVHSFDFDADSVAATKEIRERFAAQANWTVEQGSVLDTDYLKTLGTFDVVYAWGVLHHTGEMWRALENLIPLANPGGCIFLSIYNDQGRASSFWKRVKRMYNKSGWLGQRMLEASVWCARWAIALVLDLSAFNPMRTIKRYRSYATERGMSPWTDIVDWVGGYPFEVATPDAIFTFYRDRGFVLQGLRTCGGRMGCNEFVIQRQATDPQRSHPVD